MDDKCTCTQAALDGDESICAFCQKQGALDAGIPLSVIEGKTKLSDHFSESYINHMCNRKCPSCGGPFGGGNCEYCD